MISLVATFSMGLLFGWFFWGRLKNKISAVELDWRNRYLSLDNDYQAIVSSFSELELELNSKTTHIGKLNSKKNDLAVKLNSAKSSNIEVDKELEELKNQLGQITARCHITSKELESRNSELAELQAMPNEVSVLKSLLGKATQRYNNNNLELKNASEELVAVQNQNDEANKRIDSLNKELEHLSTQLIKRDREFKNQVVSFANLQNELSESNETLKIAQSKLNTESNHVLDNSKEQDEKILALESQLIAVSKQHEVTQTELLNAKKHIPELDSEIRSLRDKVPSLESTLKQRDSSIAALESEVSRLANLFPPLQDQLDIRNAEVDELKQQAHTLQQRVPALKSTIAARDAHIRELEVFIKEAQRAILKPTNRSALANGNGKPTNDVSNGHRNGSNNVVHINSNGTSKTSSIGADYTNGQAKRSEPAIPAESNKKAVQKSTKRKIKSYGLKKPTQKPDDLKLISGVGEVLEKTLHKCGIYYFEQIAGFNRKDVTAVDEMLNFKGRIDRDDWIKQARTLMREAKKSSAASKKPSQKRTSAKSRNPKMKPLGMKRPAGELDDLQLINGVGPTLERKLHRLGIYHYEQIAQLTAEDIALIDSKLKTYKGRVKRDKWPKQARKLHKEFYV